MDVRGADGKRRKKAVLTYAEVLELILLLPETWGNVIKVCRVFGVRSWEVAFIIRATNEDGEPHIEWAACGSKSKSLYTAAVAYMPTSAH